MLNLKLVFKQIKKPTSLQSDENIMNMKLNDELTELAMKNEIRGYAAETEFGIRQVTFLQNFEEKDEPLPECTFVTNI